MTAGTGMAAVAALVGDPGRANMLAAMLDGQAHTATELARHAGVATPTASGHLARLTEGRLIEVVAQGRHRYFRLASAAIARMLEGMMVVAADPTVGTPRATPRIDPALRRARTCYDHIAGELGVAIADALVARGVVALSSDAAAITATGGRWLAERGVVLDDEGSRRIACRPCLDWSERRAHLAGRLGAGLLARALATGVVRRREGTRALAIRDGDIDQALHGLGLR